jgi:hypothetical protein
MGRSVSYPSGAIVAFSSIEFEGADWEGQDQWEALREDFIQQCHYLWPSMEDISECNKWLGREDRALLSNRFAYMGLSEYCGLVAFWIVAGDDQWSEHLRGLGEKWLSQVAPKFIAEWSTLRKLGEMSNGEGVFERIEK